VIGGEGLPIAVRQKAVCGAMSVWRGNRRRLETE